MALGPYYRRKHFNQKMILFYFFNLQIYSLRTSHMYMVKYYHMHTPLPP